MNQIKKKEISDFVNRVLEDNTPTKIPREQIVQRIMKDEQMSLILMEVQKCYEDGLSLNNIETKVHELYRKQIIAMIQN